LEAQYIVSALQTIFDDTLAIRGARKSLDFSGSSSQNSIDLNQSVGFINNFSDSSRSSAFLLGNNGKPELKNIVFKLKNYFLIDAFSEEFIAYDGIRVLINLIEITSGNTRVNIFLIRFSYYLYF
jgi:hypothetical protein